jgi:hypothetical protein
MMGFLNADSMAKFDGWMPHRWVQQQSMIRSDFEFGQGSPLFNVFSSDNQFTDITIRNVTFKNLYFRMQSSVGREVKAILDTTVNAKAFLFAKSITIQSVDMSSCTFETGTGYFGLNG